MNKNIFSLPVSRKRQTSMKRRFIGFSIFLFMLIFIIGSAAFIVLMGQLLHRNAQAELRKTVELERLRLEASVKSEIAIVLKMADSPLIKRYFTRPDNRVLEEFAFEEIAAYERALMSKTVFWINDIDRKFYTTGYEPYPLDPDNPENYWYNMTLYETDVYNFNINHNPDLNITNLWINAPVFNDEQKPIGMVGSRINLTVFFDLIFSNYYGVADLLFFNSAGEITGYNDIEIVTNKVKLDEALGSIGVDILNFIGDLETNEIKYFDIKKPGGIAILGAIPALDWYIAAVHFFTYAEELQTGMTFLFIIMMAVILTVFAVFNIFVIKLLEPLYNIVKEIGQISGDWDLKQQNEITNKDEIETLGEFLNMTIIDQLTSIYNRRYFDGNMKKIIKALSRTGSKLSLLMIDIDFFKKYNDTYGHDMGDNCLKEVAAILSKTIIREEDFVARYGGEEFVVVLPNTDENGAKLIADRLLINICSEKILHENSDVAPYVTVSIGGTTGIVDHLQEESDYVKNADIALYQSKQNGRNKYTFKAFEKGV